MKAKWRFNGLCSIDEELFDVSSGFEALVGPGPARPTRLHHEVLNDLFVRT